MESVKRSCDKFGLSKNEVIFTGRVPHDQVSSYYSIIDIAPIPRTSLPVTEMVSPMKPFEAMSMEKLVIVSNVDALDEIIFDDSIGRKFEKNNVLELAEVLSDSVRNPELRAKIGKSSRKWVIENRDWSQISKKIVDVYDSLLS